MFIMDAHNAPSMSAALTWNRHYSQYVLGIAFEIASNEIRAAGAKPEPKMLQMHPRELREMLQMVHATPGKCLQYCLQWQLPASNIGAEGAGPEAKLLPMAKPGLKNCFKWWKLASKIASNIACNGGSSACKMARNASNVPSNFPCYLGRILAISQGILGLHMKYCNPSSGANFQHCKQNFFPSSSYSFIHGKQYRIRDNMQLDLLM